MTVKGYSGKLRTTVIGDYLKHGELQILEQERAQYLEDKHNEELKKQQQQAVIDELIAKDNAKAAALGKGNTVVPVEKTQEVIEQEIKDIIKAK